MKTIWTIIVLALFASCATQKICQRKYPPQIITNIKDSIITRDSIVYRNRIVHDTIPADTIKTEIQLPATSDPKLINLKTEKIHLENDYASADAWIENWKLKLELRQKDTVINRILLNAEIEKNHWMEMYYKEVIKEKSKPEKYIPKFVKIMAWAGGVLIFLLIGFIIMKVKKLI
jgi:hypothetical protein